MLHTDKNKNFDTQVYNVSFEKSARTFWHSHPGETVAIAPIIIHWHGAAPESSFVHLGMSTQVSKGPANWFGPVTDEEYKSATE
jgi:quercetin dioxygenase-like cupin family protein